MKAILLLIPIFFIWGCAHPITATSNKVGDARGEACASNLFFIIPLSIDHSIYKAAKKGNIERISTVDSEVMYTVIYNRICTVVRGSKKARVSTEESKPIGPVTIEEPMPLEL
jgi:hypothetical protein